MRTVRISLKLTYRCLGRCIYCEGRKQLWQARGGKDMPSALIRACERILAQSERHPFQEIHLTGGEISTLSNLAEIAQGLQETGLPLSATTAGWARKRGGWGELLERIPFCKLYISLDHPEKEGNDSIRGAGSWERATLAIKEALGVREQMGLPEITVVSVVHRHNIRRLDTLVELMHEWRVDRWLPACLENASYRRELAPTETDLAWLRDRRASHKVLDRALGTAFHPATTPQRLITHGEWPDHHPAPVCKTIGRLAIVHPNGGIYACYGSEYQELAKIGDADELKDLDFRELLQMAAKNPPAACRYCPEPIQHSQALALR